VAALARGEEGMGILLELEFNTPAVLAMVGVAQVTCVQGDLERTLVLLLEAAELAIRIGHAPALADTLVGFAAYASACGQFGQAARLLGAIAAAQERMSWPVLPHHAQHRRTVEAVHSALGEHAYVAATDEGRALSLDEATAEAMALGDETKRPSVPAVDRRGQALGADDPAPPARGWLGDDTSMSPSGAA